MKALQQDALQAVCGGSYERDDELMHECEPPPPVLISDELPTMRMRNPFPKFPYEPEQ
jgi:hypothetical protein